MVFSNVNRWLSAFGVRPVLAYSALKGLSRYWSNYQRIKTLNSLSGDVWNIKPNYPCLTDFYDQGGTARGHYFYQDLIVAQKIFEKNPANHVDVGSRIDGFVAHVASFRRIEVLDIRKLTSSAPNITFRLCDLLNLPPEFTEYADSVSCLHVLEHIGLGRYGDSIELAGHSKGFNNLAKIVKPGGTLYLSVPFGIERIEYNAHRVFDLKTIVRMVEPVSEVVEFAMVDDSGELRNPADLNATLERSGTYRFALAIFELRKPV
jgi:SAM-dependent methyltransferase